MLAAQNGESVAAGPTYDELEREVEAWRAAAPKYLFDESDGRIVPRLE